MAPPQSLIGPQLDLASSSDRLADEPLEFRNQLVYVDQFGAQSLTHRKGASLRRQLCTKASGPQSGCTHLPDPAIIRRILDEFEGAGDHCKQVVEVVPCAAGEHADGLHLLP